MKSLNRSREARKENFSPPPPAEPQIPLSGLSDFCSNFFPVHVMSKMRLLVVTLLAMAAATHAATNIVQVSGAGVDLRKQARAYEQSGQKLKAAAAYEQILKTDPATRMVLAPRLVAIYAQAGETNKALDWAHVVMQTNPEPHAYLAGVNAMLGRYSEAQGLLEAELAKIKEPRRKMLLNWQLADVYEKTGKPEKAAKALAQAHEAVQGTPDEAAAQRRLDQHNRKHKPPKTE
jgi:tetratricopeptide (TPR) repeat protein